ncbi:MAG: rod shape-determining protein [Vulcanimicrobiota bacterium]
MHVGIDLGTATVLVYVKGKGIVIREPSVVAIDKKNGAIKAVGKEAREMLGRTHENIVAIRPLRDGVIANFNATEKMLKYFIKKVCAHRFFFFKPTVVICVPTQVTSVESRAVKEAALAAGAKTAVLIQEPMAAAIGSGLDVYAPVGNMVVDIGGGTTDVAVISLGGIVVGESLRVAGNKMDEALVRYMRKSYNLLIGERTAEDLKLKIGNVYPQENLEPAEVKGRDLIDGLPRTVIISPEETSEALEEPVSAMITTIKSVLEKTPPELASDIIERGIIITGGGALLRGLDKKIATNIGVPVRVADDPISSVAVGTGKAILDMINATH